MNIRLIKQSDNPALSTLIKGIFEEFGIAKQGTVYTDPTTDDLYNLFDVERAIYWVVEEDGILLGGCGIFPTADLPNGYAELVKLYLSPSSRGKGIGKLLLHQSIQSARTLGYANLYLESFPELTSAIALYKDIGFTTRNSSLGHSGHYACTLWMELQI